MELDSWSSWLTSTIADDDTQDPTVDQEKRDRGKPKTWVKCTDAEELELVSLLQPSSLRDNPEQQCKDAELAIA